MIRKNALVSYSSEIINLLASLFFVGFFIRTYSTEIYGEFVALTSIISFATIYNFGADSLLKSGYGITLDKHGRVLIFVTSLIVVVIFGLISTLILILMNLLHYLSIIKFSFLDFPLSFDFYILGNIILVIFSVVQSHVILTSSFLIERTYNTLLNITSFVAVLIGILFHFQFSSFLIIRLSITFVLGLLLTFYAISSQRINVRNVWGILVRELDLARILNGVKSALKYISLGVSGLIIWSIDPIIIRSSLTIDDVSHYSLIFRLVTLGFFIPTAICTAISPYIIKYSADKNFTNLISLYNSTFNTLLILFLPFAFFCLLYSDLMISIWIGQHFETSAVVRFVLIIWAGLMFMNSLNTTFLVLTGNANFSIVLVLFAEAILHIILSYLLVGRFKIEGIAYSALISFSLISLPYQYYALNKNLRFFNDKSIMLSIFLIFLSSLMVLIIIYYLFYKYKYFFLGNLLFFFLFPFFIARYFRKGFFSHLFGKS